MLVVIAIIAMLAGLGLATLYQSQQSARAARTRSLIIKLNQAMATRWESYRTRRLPIDLSQLSGDIRQFALCQLLARRQLMRMELPDNWDDVTLPNSGSSNPQPPYLGPNNERPWTTLLPAGTTEWQWTGIPLPGGGRVVIAPTALSLSYYRRYKQLPSTPSNTYQGAECLYLAMTSGMGDESASDLIISTQDIGDYDNDGALEFHDGWGRPIDFIRWPAGFYSDLQPGDPSAGNTYAGHDPAKYHDPFDPLKVDPLAFELTPLIYSGGPDGDLALRTHVGGGSGYDLNDPYFSNSGAPCLGAPDVGVNGGSSEDNIHNHLLDLRR
jgi:type II secretory pathway pseudopilin PulG